MIAWPCLAQSLQFHGFLTAREVRVRSDEPSWVDGGYGRFDAGGHRTSNLLVGQLGVDWTPTRWLLVHADGVARNSRAAGQGRRAGVVQGYVDLFSERWRLRLGSFWLPTSRENVDSLWNSRYTITYSAWNTWVGQEVRPTGADLQFSPNFYLTLGATAFRDNDTLGTLLSARGWTLGNRLSAYNEVVPAIPDTTRPIGPDLDSKNGYAERVRIQLPERAMLQVTHLDNRASIGHGSVPDVPWLTRFNVVGATIGTTSPTTVSAEWAYGSTTIGFPGGTFKLNFDTIYVLASHKRGANRVSARIERFSTDFDHGHAVTLALFHDMSANLRTGAEYVHATGDTPGSTITIELRYGF